MSQATKSNQPMHTGWHAGGRFSVVPMFSFPGYPEVRQVPEGGSLLSSTGFKGLGVSFLSFVTVELTCILRHSVPCTGSRGREKSSLEEDSWGSSGGRQARRHQKAPPAPQASPPTPRIESAEDMARDGLLSRAHETEVRSRMRARAVLDSEPAVGFSHLQHRPWR